MKNVVALQKAEVKNTTVVMDISALIEAKAVTVRKSPKRSAYLLPR